jgi:hypothetical protein
MSGGSKSQTVSNEPWDAQEDFLIGSGKSIYTPQGQSSLAVGGLYPRAYQASFQPRSFFPGQTYAGMSPYTGQALQNAWTFGAAPSATEAATNRQLQGTLGGDYLFGGKGFDAAYNAAANKIIPQVSSLFSGAGRYGSGLAQQAMTSALADAFAGQYGEERGKQLLAAGMAPQMQGMEQQRLAAQQGVGAGYEQWAQKPISEAMQRWEFAQNEPYERLNWFNSILQPGNTYSQQSTTGGGSSTAANILGGGLAGSALGPMIGSGIASFAPQSAMLGLGAFPWGLAGMAAGGLLGAVL